MKQNKCNYAQLKDATVINLKITNGLKNLSIMKVSFHDFNSIRMVCFRLKKKNVMIFFLFSFLITCRFFLILFSQSLKLLIKCMEITTQELEVHPDSGLYLLVLVKGIFLTLAK